MTKTKPTWAKPELVRLGKIGNVAGNAAINAQSQILRRRPD
jgi:hypothetical protein